MGSGMNIQNLQGKRRWVPTLLYQLLLVTISQVAWSAEMEATLSASPLSEDAAASALLQPSERAIQVGDYAIPEAQDSLAVIAQSSLIEIIGVEVTPIAEGLEILLQTEQGLSLPVSRTAGNALIADIPNAVITDDFSQANPIEGIALVSITGLPDNRVRIAITGTDAPPTADLRTIPTGLALSVTTGTATAASEDEAIQVVVTGEENEGYSPSEATTATRTDTPLRDIPQSIQVIPRQVIEDQAITRTSDALRNVSGVSVQREFGDSIDVFTIRGFSSFQSLRNGVRFESAYLSPNNIERIEVLKGPASVLYG
jgi:iron complex outermembrane recepter protein